MASVDWCGLEGLALVAPFSNPIDALGDQECRGDCKSVVEGLAGPALRLEDVCRSEVVMVDNDDDTLATDSVAFGLVPSGMMSLSDSSGGPPGALGVLFRNAARAW
jgi:hypothetical protein